MGIRQLADGNADLSCDRCSAYLIDADAPGEEIFVSSSRDIVRNTAMRKGWLETKSGKIFCPMCVKYLIYNDY